MNYRHSIWKPPVCILIHRSQSVFSANGVIRLDLLNLYILRDADAFVKGLQQQHDSTSSPCSVELGKIRIPP